MFYIGTWIVLVGKERLEAQGIFYLFCLPFTFKKKLWKKIIKKLVLVPIFFSLHSSQLKNRHLKKKLWIFFSTKWGATQNTFNILVPLEIIHTNNMNIIF